MTAVRRVTVSCARLWLGRDFGSGFGVVSFLYARGSHRSSTLRVDPARFLYPTGPHAAVRPAQYHPLRMHPTSVQAMLSTRFQETIKEPYDETRRVRLPPNPCNRRTRSCSFFHDFDFPILLFFSPVVRLVLLFPSPCFLLHPVAPVPTRIPRRRPRNS